MAPYRLFWRMWLFSYIPHSFVTMGYVMPRFIKGPPYPLATVGNHIVINALVTPRQENIARAGDICIYFQRPRLDIAQPNT